MAIESVNSVDMMNLGGRFFLKDLYNRYRKDHGSSNLFRQFLKEANLSYYLYKSLEDIGAPTLLADELATCLGYHPSEIWPNFDSQEVSRKEDVIEFLLLDLSLENIKVKFTDNEGKVYISKEKLIRDIINHNQNRIITPDRIAQAVKTLIEEQLPWYVGDLSMDLLIDKSRDIMSKIATESYQLMSVLNLNNKIVDEMPYIAKAIETANNSTFPLEFARGKANPLSFLLIPIFKKKVFVCPQAMMMLASVNQERLEEIEQLLLGFFSATETEETEGAEKELIAA